MTFILDDPTITDKNAAIELLLIEYNYNRIEFERYYLMNIKQTTETYLSTPDKLYYLLFKRKEITQVIQQPGYSFDQGRQNIKDIFENWLTQEISFYEKISQYCQPFQSPFYKEDSFTKVNCNLSVDQIAILIRSAALVHVILAPSLNKIFKTLAPFFTTTNTMNISYDSMRSKSYAAEKKDKEVVIEKLEKMIIQIKKL
jgi:hypothetical protein